MIKRNFIQEAQAMYAINNGEFESEIVSSKSKVVVILTQDWCPQWENMKSWIYELDIGEDIDTYELEYNKVDYFNEFMTFKETKWGNYNVPYLRFYKDGALIKDTNYISKNEFTNIIKNL